MGDAIPEKPRIRGGHGGARARLPGTILAVAVVSLSRANAQCPKAELAAPREVAVGQTPSTILFGNFREDRFDDLAVADVGAGAIWLLAGGEAGFDPPRQIPVPGFRGPVAAADFDSDGHLDLVVWDSSGISVLRGSGGGDFSPAAFSVPLPGVSGTFAVADFNGDGRPDLAVLDSGSQTLSIYINEATDLRLAGSYRAPAGVVFPSAPVPADFDRDGQTDVALLADDGRRLSVWLFRGDGTGGLEPPRPSPLDGAPTPGAGCVRALAPVDFNSDGNPDLVLTDSCAGTVRLLLGNGGGDFLEGYNFALPGALAAAAGDFNGDTAADVCILTDAGVTVLLGDGCGKFLDRSDVALSGTGRAIAVGNLQGGVLHIAASTGSAAQGTLVLIPDDCPLRRPAPLRPPAPPQDRRVVVAR